jgi:hypothetical protein
MVESIMLDLVARDSEKALRECRTHFASFKKTYEEIRDTMDIPYNAAGLDNQPKALPPFAVGFKLLLDARNLVQRIIDRDITEQEL